MALGMNLTGDCMKDLRHAFTTSSRHLSQYYDATGKVSSGVLGGATSWLGDFYECIGLPHSQYCLLQMYTDTPRLQQEFPIRWGLCALSSCNNTVLENNLQEVMSVGLPDTDFAFTHAKATCAQETNAVGHLGGFYGTIVFLLALFALCIIGTVSEFMHWYRVQHHPKLVHKISTHGPSLVSSEGVSGSGSINGRVSAENGGESGEEEEEEWQEWDRPPLIATIQKAIKPDWLTVLLTCFSASNNLRQLFSPAPVDHIHCLHGIKALSILWVIVGQTYIAIFFTFNMANTYDATNYTRQLFWQPIGNAYYAADTFFFISGLLVCYRGLCAMRGNNGKLSLFYFYLHRYLRLTPLLGVMLLLWMYVMPAAGDGPIWFHMTDRDRCLKYWWTNLLYIQNFYPVNPSEQCTPFTMYLALDFQFFLFAPALIWLLNKKPKYGLVVILCFVLASIVVTGALIGAYNIDINLTKSIVNMDWKAAESYVSIIYSKPYCRAAPYLLGMALGYVLYAQQPFGRTIAKVTVASLWLFILVSMVVLMLALWAAGEGASEAGAVALNITFGAGSHAYWGIVLAALVYICVHGYGGFISSVLSWNGWVAVSRVTLGIFLFHPILLCFLLYSATMPVYVSILTVMQYGCCVLVFSVLLSWLFKVILELPLNNLQNL